MKNRRVFFLLTLTSLLLALFVIVCGAQEMGAQEKPQASEQTQEQSAEEAPIPPSQDMTWLLLKTIGILALLVLIMYIVLKSSKRFLYGRGAQNSSAEIQIRGSRMLGPKKSLYFVEAMGHILLLGVTDSQISVLLDLPREALTEEQRNLWDQQNGASHPNFKKLINQVLRK